nr:transposase [Enterocloster clostridioformis]
MRNLGRPSRSDFVQVVLSRNRYSTTNAIESLNSTYRKLNRQRSVFPGGTALLKALYLATFEATKKWTMPIRNWGQVYGELSIMYEGRLPE